MLSGNDRTSAAARAAGIRAEAVRQPGRFRERIAAQFLTAENLNHLQDLFRKRVPVGPQRDFILQTMRDAAQEFAGGVAAGDSRIRDEVASDPLAQRGELQSAVDFWPEVRRINRIFYEERMSLVREQAGLLAQAGTQTPGELPPGPRKRAGPGDSPVLRDGYADDNEPYHMRMFNADSLRPPGAERLNGPGPNWAIFEDQSSWLPKGERSRAAASAPRRADRAAPGPPPRTMMDAAQLVSPGPGVLPRDRGNMTLSRKLNMGANPDTYRDPARSPDVYIDPIYGDFMYDDAVYSYGDEDPTAGVFDYADSSRYADSAASDADSRVVNRASSAASRVASGAASRVANPRKEGFASGARMTQDRAPAYDSTPVRDRELVYDSTPVRDRELVYDSTPVRDRAPVYDRADDDPTLVGDPTTEPWAAGDLNQLPEDAVAEYWNDHVRPVDTALGASEQAGISHGAVESWGAGWQENGGARFMRYECIPVWQKGGRSGYEYDIEENLGTSSRELDSNVRRWDMERVRQDATARSAATVAGPTPRMAYAKNLRGVDEYMPVRPVQWGRRYGQRSSGNV